MKEILFILLEIAYKTVLFGIAVMAFTGKTGGIVNGIVDSVSILMRVTIGGIAICLFFGNTFIMKTIKKSP